MNLEKVMNHTRGKHVKTFLGGMGIDTIIIKKPYRSKRTIRSEISLAIHYNPASFESHSANIAFRYM